MTPIDLYDHKTFAGDVEPLLCGDCGQAAYYDFDDDAYHHLYAPDEGCFLIPAEVREPLPLVRLLGAMLNTWEVDFTRALLERVNDRQAEPLATAHQDDEPDYLAVEAIRALMQGRFVDDKHPELDGAPQVLHVYVEDRKAVGIKWKELTTPMPEQHARAFLRQGLLNIGHVQ